MHNKNILIQKDFIKEIKELYNQILLEDRFRGAFDLAIDLEKAFDNFPDLKKYDYELYKIYKKYIIRLKWVGLPIMKEERLLKLFTRHFTEIFKIENYQLWPKFRHYLLGIFLLPERDRIKKEIKNVLMNNEELITRNEIKSGKEYKKPSVKNWIKDYVGKYGNKKVNKLNMSQYFTNSENVRSLDEEEKRRIKTLIEFFEKLKYTSTTLEGLEEEIPIDDKGNEGVIKNGVFIPRPRNFKFKLDSKRSLKNDNKNKKDKGEFSNEIDYLREQRENYPLNSLERRAIEEEIKKLSRNKNER